MGLRAVSHVAIGVTDMDRSLAFYRDVLGLRVTLDTIEGRDGTEVQADGLNRFVARRRRAVYLRWDDGPDATFLVLSAPSRDGAELPLRLDQLGIHHVAFWVDDIEPYVDRLRAAGVRFRFGPEATDTAGYGEPPGNTVATCIFEDPDGVLLQLDQRAD
jgi:catechol 2,3-dioxygenase-like lactoylglutathione lyase family enzyme